MSSTADKHPNFGEKILLSVSSLLPRTGGLFGIPRLLGFRSVLRALNLYPAPLPDALPPTSSPPDHRTGDASGNDPQNPSTGASGTPFGRNMPTGPVDVNSGPPVQLVAQRLLARRRFVPAGDQLNVLAAAWIQAMAHDWMEHQDGEEEVELAEGAAGGCPMKSFRFRKTERREDGSFVNRRTHWWDASFMYGQTEADVRRARTGSGGKLHQGKVSGVLPLADDATPLVGDAKNSWVGVALLQDLFLREHNMVADVIAREHPELEGDDERLFNLARLVVAAIVAKVHTVDWTVELLKNETLRIGMNANWYGVLRPLGLSKKDPPGPFGLVGKETNNHGVPYCLTEEFVAVYRLHPMIPDGLPMPNGLGFVTMDRLIGPKGERFLREEDGAPEGTWDALVRYPCGNLSLFNYPRVLRDVKSTDDRGRTDVEGTFTVDLAALDLYRDRERGILKYNAFRKALHLKPFKNYEDLTGLPATSEEVKALVEVYGANGIDDLDLLVGNLAEKKIKGFAISETSFLIFLLMASRRLEADRFFTSDFNEETYTRAGFAWVKSVTGIKDLLERHFPGIAKNIPEKESAFKPFDKWPQTSA